MGLSISVLYLLLHIAIVLLCAALIWWFFKWMGIAIDATVFKLGQAIVAILILILIVSWFAGILPPRGIFSGVVAPTVGKLKAA